MTDAPATARAFADNFAYEPTTHVERASAFVLAGALVAASVSVAAVAHARMPMLPSFVLLVESIAIVAMLLTASMLHAQYRARGYAPLAILSFAFAGAGLLHVVYAVTFPGIFSPGGLLGAGPQSSAWTGVFARVLFGGLVAAFVAAEWCARRGRPWERETVAAVGQWTAALTIVATLGVTIGQPLLPVLVSPHGTFTSFEKNFVQPVLLLLPLGCAVALAIVCGLRTRVAVWLAVTLLASVLEICTSGVLSNARFTAGWYVSRIDLVAGSILFIVAMQVQLAGILERAARASRRSQALFAIVSGDPELARGAIDALLGEVRGELDFQWAFFARIEDGRATIETSVGETPYGGDPRVRLETSLLHAVTGRELFVLEDASMASGDESRALWAAFMSVPVFVDGKLYGSAGFASRRRRRVPINDADRDFVYLLGILLGSSIERSRRAQHLAGLAYFDSLTGLPNRTQFLARLRERLAYGERYGSKLAVHFLDLDRFKEINDRNGHAVGDQVLHAFAERLRLCVREGDLVARMGGDEFVVLQHVDKSYDEANHLAARVADLSKTPVATSAGSFPVGVSIGTACYPRDGDDASELLAIADAGQYKVKRRRGPSSNAGTPNLRSA